MNIKTIFSATAAAVMFTACVGDLNTVPLNKTDVTSESAYGSDEAGYLQGLTKVYALMINDDKENPKLEVSDGGASEFIRAFWSTQEVTADAAKCAWGDAWVNDLNNCTWKGDVLNDAVYAVYVRTLQGIAYANEFLRQTSSANLQSRGVSAEVARKIDQFRAETRFLRAYYYWAALDTFGMVPFSTEDSPFGGGYNPPQTDRVTVFNFVIGELEELAGENSAMPAAQSNYPRADKGSCLGLLARMYLNAEVYTGTAMWSEAKSTCERIYRLGYKLAPTHAEIFRGDNGENPDARGEMLFAASYDAENARSYGGTTYLTLSTLCSNETLDDKPTEKTGINGGWAGNRVPYEYIQKFFTDVKNPDYKAAWTVDNPGYEYKDKRAGYFFIQNRSESMQDALNIFTNGWSCIKFNNVPHNIENPIDYKNTAVLKTFSDIDWPLIRLGEIHLIYAEACMHAGGDASTQLAQLASRAGVAAVKQADVTNDWLMEERARELMWEGHRRTDLIRYKKWISGYNWTYKGGTFAGKDLPSHFNVFPIPSSELSTNLDLEQNTGYARP